MKSLLHRKKRNALSLTTTTGFGVWGLVLISNVFIIAAVHELGFRV